MRSLSSTSTSSGGPGPSGLARQNSTSLAGKPGALPANLDDMKVGGLPRCSFLGKAAGPDPAVIEGRTEFHSGLLQKHLGPVRACLALVISDASLVVVVITISVISQRLSRALGLTKPRLPLSLLL